ncbi:MAG: cobalt-zinc-cadmium efflux system outer membrane protein [Planctomycetota bacterium]|jgi:cobalt-zinc-cadmium efflux system outer membrane protein
MTWKTNDSRSLVLTLSTLLVFSCVQVEPQPDFEKARSLVEQSTGHDSVFDPYDEPLSESELQSILADGLSLDEALRVALLNNRELQAEFQEIGIAHADWVQAQLLTNPSVDVLLRFPSNGGRGVLEATVGAELLDLWRIPVRTEAAKKSLEATVLRIARSAGVRLAQTRNSFYAVVAAEELHQLELENAELATRSFEAVQALHKAGASDALDVSLAHGPLLAAQLAVSTSRMEAANSKRELAKLLSLEQSVDGLNLIDSLPAPVTTEFDSEALVQRALESRLDLRAIANAVEALEIRVELERREAWGDASVGISGERPSGPEDNLIGPSLSLTLPIFDQNQAQVAKASFRLEQMVKLHEAAQIAVAQDVRASADRVNSASINLELYNQGLLPQSQLALDLAQESFEAGHIILLELIAAQRQSLDARKSLVTLKLEAATSASDLERVVGAPLPK